MRKTFIDELKKPIFICLIYSLVNILLHSIVIKETSIIRSDGGGGIDEFMGKAIVSIASILFLLAGVICSIAACRSREFRPLFVGLSVAASLALIFFAALSIIDACSDHTGYCRAGYIYINVKN
jgi:hypothetical protein